MDHSGVLRNPPVWRVARFARVAWCAFLSGPLLAFVLVPPISLYPLALVRMVGKSGSGQKGEGVFGGGFIPVKPSPPRRSRFDVGLSQENDQGGRVSLTGP